MSLAAVDDGEREDLRQDEEPEEQGVRTRHQMAAVGSRPGAELSLYVRQTAPMKWEVCTPLAYGCKRVSRVFFLCYQRELWAPASDRELHVNAVDKAAGAAIRYADRDTMTVLIDGFRREKIMSDMLAIENFAMKYHPENPWTKWVVWCGEMSTKIARATGERKKQLVQEACERENEILHPGLFLSLLQSVQREAGKERDYEGTSIPGQGAGYPTVYQYVTACAFFHKCLRLHHEDPSADQRVLDILTSLRDEHLTEHVSVLDVLEDLPFLREAVFSDATLEDGEKLMWWALILVMLEHGCRLSEVSVYCPMLNQVY